MATPVLDANNGEAHTAELVTEQSVKPPKFLLLRTRRYKKSEASRGVDNDDDFDEEATCTICFVLLEDNDRVGALPCNHIFHVDCLKEWLRRRNICPLCQERDVATPRYEEIEGESNEVESANQIDLTAPSGHDEQMAAHNVDLAEPNDGESSSQIMLTGQQGRLVNPHQNEQPRINLATFAPMFAKSQHGCS